MKIPIRYLPKKLNNSDKKKQASQIKKSRKLYKQHKYFTRKNVKSFVSKPSPHVSNAQRIYKVDKITPNGELAQKTGCSISTLQKIMKKGQGAYFSSGSRPNQTSQSWGNARLASALTSGKAAAVDFSIIEKGCDHNKKAYRLAKSAKRKYGFGTGKTKKISI
uniref:DUF5824 domain-containing protein n=1 Tax=viral metagenome TaxID=1070528 RepID=A0A6C0HYR5_9ZZZZ